VHGWVQPGEGIEGALGLDAGDAGDLVEPLPGPVALFVQPAARQDQAGDALVPAEGGLVTRRRLAPPAAAAVYELTPRGHELLPALAALAEWGAADLAGPRPTDALRAHWFAIPLMARLAETAASIEGTANILLGEGAFHILISAAGPAYGHALAEHPDAQLTFDGDACAALARGEATLPEMIKNSQVRVDGDSPLAQALRNQ
jgi:hypothetical protein